jgi:hypothetical protein
MIDPLVLERDLALDDEAALDRALRIVKLFYIQYGSDPHTKKYAAELAEKLIKVKRNARARHQAAERRRIEVRDEAEIAAQLI